MAAIKGGDKMMAALAVLASKLKSDKTLRVGFLEGATYPDGKKVALIAAFNEYGVPSRGQPPRPFFRNMVADHSDEWPKAIGGLLKKTNYDVQKTLELTGEGIKGQLQQSIVDLVTPPLAPSTVKAKGSDKPLIETTHMLNSVDYEVVPSK